MLKAAELLRPERVRIVVPANTTAWKVARIQSQLVKLQSLGLVAELLPHGQTFDEARAWALTETSDEFYLDPYEDPWVVAGQGTIGLELVAQISKLLESGNYREVHVIAPVGGGGLLAGTATALRMASAWEPAWRNVQLNLTGLSLGDYHASLGDAIRVRSMADSNRAHLNALNVSLRAMGDAEMTEGVRFVASDLNTAVEGASGGTLWPVLTDAPCSASNQRLVVCLLSGGNTGNP